MHLGMSYTEIKRLPIRYRRWFLDRVVAHFEQQNKRRESFEPGVKHSEPSSKISNDDIKKAEKFFKKF